MLDSNLKTSATQTVKRVDPKLLEILVCPLTKSTLEYDAEKQELISRQAKLVFPVREGIPVMLVSEAKELKTKELYARELED